MKYNNNIWGYIERQWPSNGPESRGVAKILANCAYHALGSECGEIDLIVTIITHAARERDLTYLQGGVFSKHCGMIGLNEAVVYETIERLWGMIDSEDS